MYEVFSEVRATLSVEFLNDIGGLAKLEALHAAFSAPTFVEIEASGNGVQLCGTFDSILFAKNTLEEAHKEIQLKRLSEESKELDSTTFSEENSSQADEGNTSYDKEEGTDKVSWLSDDKEQGPLSPPPRESRCMRMLPKRVRILDHRARQQLLRKKKPLLPPDHPDYLSENLRQMKLAGGTTAAEDSDSAGTEEQRLRRPCRARNFEYCHPIKRKRRILNCPHCSYKTTKPHYYERHQRFHSHKAHRHHPKEHSTSSNGGGSSDLFTSPWPDDEDDRKHRCPKCKMGLVQRNRLGPAQCDFCSIMSRSKAFLKRHAQYLQARYSCDKCDKRFVSRCNLRTHMNMHVRPRRPLTLPSTSFSSPLPGPSYLPIGQSPLPEPSREMLQSTSFLAPSAMLSVQGSTSSNNALPLSPLQQ